MRSVLFLFISFLFLAFHPHPFYLAVLDLKYEQNSGRFQGTVKVFTNDLEEALRKLGHVQADLIHPKDKEECVRWLKDYLFKRLQIRADEMDLRYELLGFEQEEESTWIYLESQNCPRPKQLEVNNRILYDFLPEQINIINLEHKGKMQSHKLSQPETLARFTLN